MSAAKKFDITQMILDLSDRMDDYIEKYEELKQLFDRCEASKFELQNDMRRMQMRPLTERIGENVGEVRDVLANTVRNRAEAWLGDGDDYGGDKAEMPRRNPKKSKRHTGNRSTRSRRSKGK